MNGPDRQKKRQVIRPEEVFIFLMVAVVFANSVYNLVYHGSDKDWGLRAPAMVGGGTLLNLDVSCDGENIRVTSATKLRISGPICGMGEARTPAAANFIRTEISNETNRSVATVFTDLSLKKFSTDYIPLNPGDNQITLRFHYANGKVKSQTLKITKE